MDAKTKARWGRRIAVSFAITGAIVWLGGTAAALYGITPTPADRCLFRVWASTWPIFLALPPSGQDTFVKWSFVACGEG